VVGERTGLNGMRLLDLLFDSPLVNVNLAKDNLAVAFQTANSLVGEFEGAGLLTEITGGKRGRVSRYDPYLALLQDEPLFGSGAGRLQTTETRGIDATPANPTRTPAR